MQLKGPTRRREDRKKRVRKRRVVGIIYTLKYSWKGHKDRHRHKNRINRWATGNFSSEKQQQQHKRRRKAVHSPTWSPAFPPFCRTRNRREWCPVEWGTVLSYTLPPACPGSRGLWWGCLDPRCWRSSRTVEISQLLRHTMHESSSKRSVVLVQYSVCYFIFQFPTSRHGDINRLERRGKKKNLFSRVNFLCWLLFGVRSTPVLQQRHVEDPGHSAKSTGGRLHLNTHTPLTQRSRSGLTVLSRHSVRSYQGKRAPPELVRKHQATVISARWAIAKGFEESCTLRLFCKSWQDPLTILIAKRFVGQYVREHETERSTVREGIWICAKSDKG